jgi:NagD protein
MPDVGALTLCIEATTGRKPDLIMGKPEIAAGEGFKKRYNLPSEKIAMVGDRLYTDIQFGINNNFTSIVVLSGETTIEMATAKDAIKADYIFGTISDILPHLE